MRKFALDILTVDFLSTDFLAIHFILFAAPKPCALKRPPRRLGASAGPAFQRIRNNNNRILN